MAASSLPFDVLSLNLKASLSIQNSAKIVCFLHLLNRAYLRMLYYMPLTSLLYFWNNYSKSYRHFVSLKNGTIASLVALASYNCYILDLTQINDSWILTWLRWSKLVARNSFFSVILNLCIKMKMANFMRVYIFAFSIAAENRAFIPRNTLLTLNTLYNFWIRWFLCLL